MGLSTTTSVVRSLRIGRMFKLFRNLKKLQIIFSTFLNTLSSLLNVGGLLILIMYIYAVIGISLFADVKVTAPMHSRLDFNGIFNAFITLFRVATGEGWNDLMDVLSTGNGYQGHFCT